MVDFLSRIWIEILEMLLKIDLSIYGYTYNTDWNFIDFEV